MFSATIFLARSLRFFLLTFHSRRWFLYEVVLIFSLRIAPSLCLQNSRSFLSVRLSKTNRQLEIKSSKSKSHTKVEQWNCQSFIAGPGNFRLKSDARINVLLAEDVDPPSLSCTYFANGRTSIFPQHPQLIAWPVLRLWSTIKISQLFHIISIMTSFFAKNYKIF